MTTELMTPEAVLTQADWSTEQKIEAILAYGVEVLELNMGLTSHIDGETYTVKYFFPPDVGLQHGQVFEKSKTYCDITMRLRKTIGITPMRESEHNAHPCYEFFRLESYIGTPLMVKDKFYGTLNFTSPDARLRTFSKAERDMVESWGGMIAQLIEGDLAQD